MMAWYASGELLRRLRDALSPADLLYIHTVGEERLDTAKTQPKLTDRSRLAQEPEEQILMVAPEHDGMTRDRFGGQEFHDLLGIGAAVDMVAREHRNHVSAGRLRKIPL